MAMRLLRRGRGKDEQQDERYSAWAGHPLSPWERGAPVTPGFYARRTEVPGAWGPQLLPVPLLPLSSASPSSTRTAERPTRLKFMGSAPVGVKLTRRGSRCQVALPHAGAAGLSGVGGVGVQGPIFFARMGRRPPTCATTA